MDKQIQDLADKCNIRFSNEWVRMAGPTNSSDGKRLYRYHLFGTEENALYHGNAHFCFKKPCIEFLQKLISEKGE